MHNFAIFKIHLHKNCPPLVTFTNHESTIGETKSSTTTRKKGNSCWHTEKLLGQIAENTAISTLDLANQTDTRPQTDSDMEIVVDGGADPKQDHPSAGRELVEEKKHRTTGHTVLSVSVSVGLSCKLLAIRQRVSSKQPPTPATP